MQAPVKTTLIMPNEDSGSPYPMVRTAPLLGIGYLAAILEQNNFPVQILDATAEDLSPEKALEKAVAFGAQVVGVSMDLLSYDYASAVAALAKERGLHFVVGGPEVTLNAKKVIDETQAEVGVIGEGEMTILELLALLDTGGAGWNPEALSQVDGIVYRNAEGEITQTSQRARITELDDLPFVPYDKFPMDRYDLRYHLMRDPPVFPVYTSRGCPYNCSFCSSREIWHRKSFFMSPERVLNEIEHIIEKYNPAGLYFYDDNFSQKKQRLIDICEGMIERKIKIPWVCLGRTEGLNEDLFRLMRRAGCRGMWFGIESGSKRILTLIRKDMNQEKALEVIAAGNRAGLAMGASIIVGFPTQTQQEEQETLDFLRRAKLTFVIMSPYVGYPCSDMYREFLADGGKYVHSEARGIALVNSEGMTWPEKVQWAKRYEHKFNRTFRLVLYHCRIYGIRQTIWKVIQRFLGDLKRT